MSGIPENVRMVVDTDYIRMKRPDFIRAERSDLDAVIALYREARNAAPQELAEALPMYDRVERDVEEGLLWYTRRDGVLTAACAVTPEPVFGLEWEVEERDEHLGRFPGENWFRPGQNCVSALRQAAKPGPGREWRVGEITLLAAMLARSCGIYELRTRNICDDMPTSRVLSTYGCRLVGACRDPDGLRWYGYCRYCGGPREDDFSHVYRPLREEYNGDGRRRFDYARSAEELEHLRAEGRKKDDLMEDM